MNEQGSDRYVGAGHQRQVAMLLVCFDGVKTAARVRRPLDAQLQSSGVVILDTVVVKVDARHRASVYDPRRVLAGILTPALTWGVFGAVTGSGAAGVVLSAVLGAVLGGLYAYWHEHILTKDEMTRIGTRLPAQSSAILIYVQTSEPAMLLGATTDPAPQVASVAAIGDDLSAHVVAGQSAAVGEPRDVEEPTRPYDQTALLSMILLRYPSTKTAQQIAARVATSGGQMAHPPRIELIGETDHNGHHHVADPTNGAAAWGRSNLISWGGFGLVFGALAGVIGGGGILGVLGGGLLTGVVWGLFGLGAGLLYGMWAGTAISGRRLKGVSPLLPRDSSTLLAWQEGPVTQDVLDTLTAPDAQRLVLRFKPVQGGAILDAS